MTYAPDVVVMEHGADAIRGFSADGLTWLLDPNAPHVSELQPGRIMFATGRAVGRILAVAPHGTDLAVTVGPVAFTDIVSDLQMSFEQPVDLSAAILYMAPNAPLSGEMEPLAPKSGEPAPVAVVQAFWVAPPQRSAPTGAPGQAFNLAGPMIGAPPSVKVEGWTVSPYSGGGMGVKIAKDTPGLKMVASGGVRLDRPSVKVNVDIRHGKLETAQLELRGLVGLLADVQAGTEVGLEGNINKFYYVPTDFNIPIFGKPIPIAVTLRQSFEVRTGFTAKPSTLNAGGEEDFTGAVKMGLANGSWSVSAPTSMTTARDLPESVTGVSLGGSSVIFGWGTKVIVGVGTLGFATGPYIGYNTQVSATRGPDTTAALVPVPPCHGAQLALALNVGVGYSLPAPLVSAVNAVFHLLKLNAELPPTGGVDHQETIVHKHRSIPENCAGF